MASLPNLSLLLFSDPDWGPSPIAKLCNYATYTAVNLPNLQTLDSHPLSAQTKAVAQATYLKKKMYYNMRINTLRRKAAELAQQAQQGLQVLGSNPCLSLSSVHSTPPPARVVMKPLLVEHPHSPPLIEHPGGARFCFWQGLHILSVVIYV